MRIAPRPGVMVAVVKLVVACARYPDARAIISACEILRSSVAGDARFHGAAHAPRNAQRTSRPLSCRPLLRPAAVYPAVHCTRVV